MNTTKILSFFLFLFLTHTSNTPINKKNKSKPNLYNISDQFIPEAKQASIAMIDSIKVLGFIDQSVATTQLDYFIDFSNTVLHSMIHPLIENFDADTVQASTHSFQDQLERINNRFKKNQFIIRKIKGNNIFLKQIDLVISENIIILRENIRNIRQAVFNDQFENERQVNKAKKRLMLLRNAYQFMIQELEEFQG